MSIIAYIANYCRCLLLLYTGFNAQNIPHVGFEVLNSLLKENTLFGTFMLIRLNTSKCPFKVKSNIRGFVNREHDNTQLTIKKPVSINAENILSALRAQAILKPSNENSKTFFFRSQGPSSALSRLRMGTIFSTYRKE